MNPVVYYVRHKRTAKEISVKSCRATLFKRNDFPLLSTFPRISLVNRYIAIAAKAVFHPLFWGHYILPRKSLSLLPVTFVPV